MLHCMLLYAARCVLCVTRCVLCVTPRGVHVARHVDMDVLCPHHTTRSASSYSTALRISCHIHGANVWLHRAEGEQGAPNVWMHAEGGQGVQVDERHKLTASGIAFPPCTRHAGNETGPMDSSVRAGH